MINIAPVKNLYGLILAGGKSRRMKRDKATLKFHGVYQTQWCYELLSKYCQKVFLSNRKAQSKAEGYAELPQIHDHKAFGNNGPLSGILSAMIEYPRAAWLVLACDLPFLNQKTIEGLITKRNPRLMATAYISSHDGLPEPLCTIYESKMRVRFLEFLNQDAHCPRTILMNSNIQLLKLKYNKSLDNINSEAEYRAVASFFKQLHKRGNGNKSK